MLYEKKFSLLENGKTGTYQIQCVSSEDPSNEKPGMLDWLTAKSLPQKIEADIINEYWWSLFSDSGWSEMIMGKNSRGKYSIIKPRYQYFITDQTGTSGLPLKRAEPPLTLNNSCRVDLDRLFTPHNPKNSSFL